MSDVSRVLFERVCAGLLITLPSIGPAAAAKRVGLVVGNAAYGHAGALANPASARNALG